MKKILCVLLTVATMLTLVSFTCFASYNFVTQSGVQGMEGSMAGLLNSGYRGDSGIIKTDTHKYSGNYSWQMPASSATTNYHIQVSAIPNGITLVTGKSYYFSAYMMAPDTVCDVKILAMTGTGGSSSVVIVPNGAYAIPAGEWGQVSGIFTVPEDQASFLNCLRVIVPKQPQTGYIYMDDIFVGEIELEDLELTTQFVQDTENPSKGTVTATAGIPLESITSVSITPSATVSGVVLGDDGTTITMEVSELSSFTDYILTCHAVDTQGRVVSAESTFTSGRVPEVADRWTVSFDSGDMIPDKIRTDRAVAGWSGDEGNEASGALFFTSNEAETSGYGKVNLLDYFKELGFNYAPGTIYEITVSFLHKNNDNSKRQIFLGMTENQTVKGSFDANTWHTLTYQVTASSEQLLVMNWNGNAINGDVTYLDDITIQEILPFHAVSPDNGSENVPFASGTYELSFSLSMEAELTLDNVIAEGGATIEYITGDGYDYVIGLSMLQPDTAYRISFTGVADSQGQSLTDMLLFRTLKKFEITKALSHGTATVTVKNNTAQPVEIAVTLASFRGEEIKYFVGIAMDKKTVAAGTAENFAATLPSDKLGSSQEIFIRNWLELAPIK